MGEIADDIVDGVICQECCMPLQEELGYPGLCDECKPKPKKKRKCRRKQNV